MNAYPVESGFTLQQSISSGCSHGPACTAGFIIKDGLFLTSAQRPVKEPDMCLLIRFARTSKGLVMHRHFLICVAGSVHTTE